MKREIWLIASLLSVSCEVLADGVPQGSALVPPYSFEYMKEHPSVARKGPPSALRVESDGPGRTPLEALSQPTGQQPDGLEAPSEDKAGSGSSYATHGRH